MSQSKTKTNAKDLQWRVAHAVSVEPIETVQIVSMSHDTVIIKCGESIDIGERLSFDSDTAHTPPVLTEVQTCEGDKENGYIAHCKCLMGVFDAPVRRRA